MTRRNIEKTDNFKNNEGYLQETRVELGGNVERGVFLLCRRTEKMMVLEY